jgi:glucosamine--fructose-6-phosphate aminotransferase (isomerizing)
VSLFRDEIGQQPEVAASILSASGADWVEVAAAIRAADPAGLVIAARGTSDHAAVYAKYLLEARTGLPVALAAPSLFTLYRRPPDLRRFCVLAVSQAGASTDVVSVVEEARRQGSVTVALTNDPASPLASAAAHVVPLGSGPERSVPATKTYTASLLQVALLSHALAPSAEFASALQRVPEALSAALAVEGELGPAVTELAGASRLAVLGRGYNLSTALEVGLKLMEAAYLVAEARSVADFLHGPIAIVERGFPVLLLDAAGPADEEMASLAEQLRARGARVLSIGDLSPPPGAVGVRVATGLPEELTPLPFAVAGQLLTAGLAAARSIDPDRPRGLRKVTISR